MVCWRVCVESENTRHDEQQQQTRKKKKNCRIQTFNGTVLFIGLIIESFRSFATHHTLTKQQRNNKHEHRTPENDGKRYYSSSVCITQAKLASELCQQNERDTQKMKKKILKRTRTTERIFAVCLGKAWHTHAHEIIYYFIYSVSSAAAAAAVVVVAIAGHCIRFDVFWPTPPKCRNRNYFLVLFGLFASSACVLQARAARTKCMWQIRATVNHFGNIFRGWATIMRINDGQNGVYMYLSCTFAMWFTRRKWKWMCARINVQKTWIEVVMVCYCYANGYGLCIGV